MKEQKRKLLPLSKLLCSIKLFIFLPLFCSSFRISSSKLIIGFYFSNIVTTHRFGFWRCFHNNHDSFTKTGPLCKMSLRLIWVKY